MPSKAMAAHQAETAGRPEMTGRGGRMDEFIEMEMGMRD
jgi:hypothetical protein